MSGSVTLKHWQTTLPESTKPEGACVAGRNFALGDRCLYLVREGEQTYRIGHGGAAASDTRRDLFLSEGELLAEALEGMRFFESAEILSLQVFDQRELKQRLWARLFDNHRHFREASLA